MPLPSFKQACATLGEPLWRGPAVANEVSRWTQHLESHLLTASRLWDEGLLELTTNPLFTADKFPHGEFGVETEVTSWGYPLRILLANSVFHIPDDEEPPSLYNWLFCAEFEVEGHTFEPSPDSYEFYLAYYRALAARTWWTIRLRTLRMAQYILRDWPTL